MTSLQQFAFNSQSVRVISVDGEPWFVAQDICDILTIGNVSQACAPLKNREKGVSSIDTLGGKQDVSTVSESGLYRITMKSRKPQAEPFQDWICEEVLPAIRKTGKYEVVPTQPALPQTLSEALRFAADLEDQRQKLFEANQALQIEVQTLEPKADRYDLILATDGWMTGEEVVKQLNIPKFSVRKLYDILRTEKVLFKRPSDGTNIPYANWTNEGLATIRDGQCFDGRMRFSPAFSWKGLDRILDLLRKHQIIPKDKQYRFNFDSNKIVAMKRA